MDDLFFKLFLLFLVLTLIGVPTILVVDGVKDGYAESDCILSGYDSGTHRLWRGQTICWNIISEYKEEVVGEYFILPK